MQKTWPYRLFVLFGRIPLGWLEIGILKVRLVIMRTAENQHARGTTERIDHKGNGNDPLTFGMVQTSVGECSLVRAPEGSS